MASSLDHTYTSEAELERLTGENFADFRLDDLSDPNKALIIDDLIDVATLEVDSYLEGLYLTDDLEGSKLVRWHATRIFAHHLSTRRGNSAQYVAEYEATLEALENFKVGASMLPGIGTRDDFTPAMSNQTMDERYALHKLRTHSSISVGGTDSRQDLSYLFPIDWL